MMGRIEDWLVDDSTVNRCGHYVDTLLTYGVNVCKYLYGGICVSEISVAESKSERERGQALCDLPGEWCGVWHVYVVFVLNNISIISNITFLYNCNIHTLPFCV